MRRKQLKQFDELPAKKPKIYSSRLSDDYCGFIIGGARRAEVLQAPRRSTRGYRRRSVWTQICDGGVKSGSHAAETGFPQGTRNKRRKTSLWVDRWIPLKKIGGLLYVGNQKDNRCRIVIYRSNFDSHLET